MSIEDRHGQMGRRAHRERDSRRLLFLGASVLSGLLLALAACSSTDSDGVSPRRSWSSVLGDIETARCTDVAWRAAESAEMHAKHNLERITSTPLVLSRKGIRYYVDGSDRSRVEVAIPSGARFGLHSTYIGVTLSRDTYAVLSMREAPWF